jgi:signal transduction histidine kinase
MMLRPLTVVSSVLVAVPAALVLTYGLDRVRAGDQERLLRDVVLSQVNDQLRERCDTDPAWFMTGPLIGRPINGVFVPTQPDQNEPRAKYAAQPYELFGYDEAFIGSGPATPQLPRDFRLLLRDARAPLVAPYFTPEGRGLQIGVNTGWQGSKCNYLLARLAPPPHQWRDRFTAFLWALLIIAGVSLAAAAPTVFRIRRMAAAARDSVESGFTSIAPEKLKDELSSLTFVHNDAMTELALRKARIDDQEVALKRLVQATDAEALRPLAGLEVSLAAALQQHPADDRIRDAFLSAHNLRGQLENLTAATRLKLTTGPLPRTNVDLASITRRVTDRFVGFAQARGVTLKASIPETPLMIGGDEPMLECAIANIVDNAIRYTQTGGVATVTLEPSVGTQAFRLWVADNGPGVSDELFRGLSAVRRFRGDEARNRRPDAPGLGLAVTREIADRLGLHLDLKRPGTGGFESELSPRTA